MSWLTGWKNPSSSLGKRRHAVLTWWGVWIWWLGFVACVPTGLWVWADRDSAIQREVSRQQLDQGGQHRLHQHGARQGVPGSGNCREGFGSWHLLTIQSRGSYDSETQFIKSHIKVWFTVFVASCWEGIGRNEVEWTREVEFLTVGKGGRWWVNGLCESWDQRLDCLVCFFLQTPASLSILWPTVLLGVSPG